MIPRQRTKGRGELTVIVVLTLTLWVSGCHEVPETDINQAGQNRLTSSKKTQPAKKNKNNVKDSEKIAVR